MSKQHLNTFRPRLRRLEDRLTPAAGMLDPTFGGGDGLVTTPHPAPADNWLTATTLDSLGRIIAVGKTNPIGNSYGGRFAVVRYLANGALDNTFGEGGKVFCNLGLSTFPVDVVTDESNRVVVQIRGLESGSGIGVMRLTTDGVVDASFDGDGSTWINFGLYDYPTAMTLDSMGRIVVTGSFSTGGIAVARLNPTGALDTSFDGDGKVVIDLVGTNDWASDVAVDSLDRIIIGAYVEGASPHTSVAIRLTTAGVLDSAFSGDGLMLEDDGYGYSVAVDSLDRVILARTATADVSVTRLTVGGELDVTFDGDGKYSFNLGNNEVVSGVALDSLGRIFVAGTTQGTSGTSSFTVARLNPNGGVNLTVPFGFGANGGMLEDIAVDGLDRVVVAGNVTNTSGSGLGFAIARLAKNGPLDSTFDGDGRVVTEFLLSNSWANQVATDSLGRIIVGGSDGVNNLVTRYTQDGVLDPTFGVSGKFIVSSSTYGGISMAVDALDRVIISNGNLVERLTTAGALDKSFDGDGMVTLSVPPYEGYLQSTSVLGATVKLTGAIVVLRNYSYVWGVWGPYQYTSCNLAVTQLTNTGGLDAGFGTNGTATFGYSSGSYGYAPPPNSSALTSDLKSRVVFGTTNGELTTVRRLNATGALDVSFDTDGVASIDLGPGIDIVRTLDADSQDRVVMAGGSSDSGVYQNTVARLTATGVPDIAFDGDGFVQPSAPNGSYLRAAIDGQNRLVLSGSNWVARLTSSGAYDPSFGAGGQATIAFDGADLAADKGGRAVIVGSAGVNDIESAMAVTRLTSDTSSTLKAAVQINDGAAQRSMVTSFKVTLSEPVAFPSGIAAAFQLQRTGPGTPTGLVILDLEQSDNMVDVTFNDPTYAPGLAKSLIDGRYTLTLIASKIQGAIGFLDANADGIGGDNFLLSLHRLFGDSDGNATVDQNDFIAFRNGFNNGPSQIFDFDGDGQVNQSDFIQFRNRFNASI